MLYTMIHISQDKSESHHLRPLNFGYSCPIIWFALKIETCRNDIRNFISFSSLLLSLSLSFFPFSSRVERHSAPRLDWNSSRLDSTLNSRNCARVRCTMRNFEKQRERLPTENGRFTSLRYTRGKKNLSFWKRNFLQRKTCVCAPIKW